MRRWAASAAAVLSVIVVGGAGVRAAAMPVVSWTARLGDDGGHYRPLAVATVDGRVRVLVARAPRARDGSGPETLHAWTIGAATGNLTNDRPLRVDDTAITRGRWFTALDGEADLLMTSGGRYIIETDAGEAREGAGPTLQYLQAWARLPDGRLVVAGEHEGTPSVAFVILDASAPATGGLTNPGVPWIAQLFPAAEGGLVLVGADRRDEGGLLTDTWIGRFDDTGTVRQRTDLGGRIPAAARIAGGGTVVVVDTGTDRSQETLEAVALTPDLRVRWRTSLGTVHPLVHRPSHLCGLADGTVVVVAESEGRPWSVVVDAAGHMTSRSLGDFDGIPPYLVACIADDVVVLDGEVTHVEEGSQSVNLLKVGARRLTALTAPSIPHTTEPGGPDESRRAKRSLRR